MPSTLATPLLHLLENFELAHVLNLKADGFVSMSYDTRENAYLLIAAIPECIVLCLLTFIY